MPPRPRHGWRSYDGADRDPDQTDLLSGLSGLRDIGDVLNAWKESRSFRLDAIVRHPLVAGMLSVL